MRILVNGEPRTLDPGATVASVMALLDVTPGARGVAVALDGEVVSRSRWDATELRDGARVEVVSAIGGG
ncbi:MAG: sulfur carrier protein ThiS [Solirubrobacteraceae bacterium]